MTDLTYEDAKRLAEEYADMALKNYDPSTPTKALIFANVANTYATLALAICGKEAIQ